LVADRGLNGLPYGPNGLAGLVNANGEPAPKGFAVEFGLKGFALRSPRYSACVEVGPAKTSAMTIHHIAPLLRSHLSRRSAIGRLAATGTKSLVS
jgi:hypothetical protein